MKAIYERVALWNSQRYDREFDLTLSVSLLREEYKEWLDAKEPVDKLDALCDIIYVAMGVTWKLNHAAQDIENAQNAASKILDRIINADEPNPVYFIGIFLDVLEYDDDMPAALSMALMMQAATAQALAMGLAFHQVEQALNIVCDANDSKTATKTASDVKANIDKGATFVSPEPRLQKLLNNRKEFH